MDIGEILENLKNIQQNLLEYIESESNNENDFEKFKKYISQQNINQIQQIFKGFLYLLLDISNNHSRNTALFQKIEQIFIFIKEDIKNAFTNLQIFNIFKTNKLILLILIENKILIMDEFISQKLVNPKYKNYESFFLPEISSLYGCGEIINQNDHDYQEFQKKRKNGENDNYICQLIRNDSVIEFLKFVNQTNLSLNSQIGYSMFETNQFLLKKRETTLIEYAAFFGSIQIFQYLMLNDVVLTPSLWLYTIHSKNAELIHILEENKVDQPQQSFKKCITEAIKCHHTEIANYIDDNLYEKKEKEKDKNKIDKSIVKYHNYLFFPSEFDYQFIFPYLCYYDYPIFVEYIMNNKSIDLNKTIVLKSIKIFKLCSKSQKFE